MSAAVANGKDGREHGPSAAANGDKGAGEWSPRCSQLGRGAGDEVVSAR